MKTPATYIGFSRSLMNLKIKVFTLIHFLPVLFSGKLSPGKFFRFVKRLLFFLSKMKDNKYVKTANGVKINLYVPGFPGKSYYQACRKVMEFNDKLPAVTVLMSVTSACRFHCRHCYQMLDKGKDAEIGLMVQAALYLQDQGMGFFNIEGGEPFLVYERLKTLCHAIDSRSEILINSTGDGMTAEKLKELNKNGNIIGIMFSLHTDAEEKLNDFMGSGEAWNSLLGGIQACHEAGLSVTFNSCLARDDYFNGTFERVMDRAKGFGGALIQLIKPKPAGGWLHTGSDVFSPEDLVAIKHKVDVYNNLPRYRDYPAIAAMIIDEGKEQFGCTAGGTDRFYINAKGDVQPCEFLNISFGNIAMEPFEVIYGKMRAVFHTPGDCWLCEKYASEIARIYQEEKLTSLPLDPELSERITGKLEKGDVPDFYAKVNKM